MLPQLKKILEHSCTLETASGYSIIIVCYIAFIEIADNSMSLPRPENSLSRPCLWPYQPGRRVVDHRLGQDCAGRSGHAGHAAA